MTLLVFGRTGQVARELERGAETTCLSRDRADLSEPGACAAAIRAMRPRAVINAAAWTDVDGAEDAEAEAARVNGDAPGEMAEACAALDIPLVHISTDYVFDGSGERPWSPQDRTAPLGAYGRSKLAGEEAVLAAGGRALVLRTSWVFSGHGKNFVATMLRLGATRESLSVVADQIGGPTPASDIAAACVKLADALLAGAPGGVQHFSGAPDTSWAGFARAIFAAADLPCRVEDISADDWPARAPRPANSRLDCTDLARIYGIERPDWRAALPEVIAALRG